MRIPPILFTAAFALGCHSAAATNGSTGSATGSAATTSAGAGGSVGSASTSGTSTTSTASSGAGGSVNPDAGSSNLQDPRTLTATNRCSFPVWVDALPTTTLPGGLPVELLPSQSFTAGVPNGWSGRVWGRFDCAESMGKLTCADDPYPSTLAELTLTKTPGSGLDFYDVSLVDGFDLPMALIALGFTPDPAHPYSCGAPTCSMDLRPECPKPLRDLDSSATTIVCANDACKVIGNNDPAAASCIYPNMYTEFFKTSCPQAYSYPSDDPTSTFTCKGLDYQVVFCP
jgi:Thaumatin family